MARRTVFVRVKRKCKTVVGPREIFARANRTISHGIPTNQVPKYGYQTGNSDSVMVIA